MGEHTGREGEDVRDTRYQGAYAESYVRTLALAAGLNVLRPELDDYAIDMMIKYVDPAGRSRNWSRDVQVKSWSTPVGSDDSWNFGALNEVQYNALVAEDSTSPPLLVVVIVPPADVDLASMNEDGLLLRKRAYYTEIPGPRIESPSKRRKRAVAIPKANVLTDATLRRLVCDDLVVGI